MVERQTRPRLDQVGVLRRGGRASLRPDQVRQNARGDYVVQGYHDPIAAKFALPSADGDYWIFYRDNLDGSRSAVFCFFVPIVSK